MTVLDLAIGLIFYRSLWACLIFLPAMRFLYLQMEKRARDKEKALLNNHFKEALKALSNRIGSGCSLEKAFEYSLEDVKVIYEKDDPVVLLLEEVCNRNDSNIPVDEAFESVAEKYGDADIIGFAKILKTVKRSGGSLQQVVMRTAGQISEKIEIEEEIQTLLTARKNEFRIMLAMPVLIIAYMSLFYSGLMEPLYSTIPGRLLMTLALAVYFAAFIVGERILEVKAG